MPVDSRGRIMAGNKTVEQALKSGHEADRNRDSTVGTLTSSGTNGPTSVFVHQWSRGLSRSIHSDRAARATEGDHKSKWPMLPLTRRCRLRQFTTGQFRPRSAARRAGLFQIRLRYPIYGSDIGGSTLGGFLARQSNNGRISRRRIRELLFECTS